jgi:hypothetical protein
VVLLLSERLRVPNWATADKHDDPVWQLVFSVTVPIVAIAVATAITYGFERPILQLKKTKPGEVLGALIARAKKGRAKAG